MAGVDLGARMLRNAPKADNVDYLQASTSSLPFKANSADLITKGIHEGDLVYIRPRPSTQPKSTAQDL